MNYLSSWLHRPFYIARFIATLQHKTTSCQLLIRLAQRGIGTSCALIRMIAAHHRHKGIWSLARPSFGYSLLLIASASYNLQNGNTGNQTSFSMRQYIQVPPDWHTLTRITLATIHIWDGSGANDSRAVG
ncbi:hypothetical protein GGS26DRAFT_117332 [Hypomontagnella submonticulosa]|nr:hypothetical protein GGS26DRAFT_117332 [Hypomontagnella submonticulosa]